MGNSQGADAPLSNPIDWDAYGKLQRRAQTLDTSFGLNGIERGLNRLLRHPKRKSIGATLARRLERDARKFLRVHGGCEVLLGDLEAIAPPDDASAMQVEDLEGAIGIIRAGMLRLDSRHRLVLTMRALDRPPEELGIKARQMRNLLRESRDGVWLERGVSGACELLREGLATWRFLTVKLCAPLLSA